MNRSSTSYGTFALITGFVLIWGTGYWPTEVANRHTEIVLLSGLRVVGGALPLLAFAMLSGAKMPRGRMLAWAVGSGLVMIALSHWGTTEAVARAGAGNAAVVVNAAPLIVVALGWMFLREKLSLVGLSGAALGFGGVIFMVWSQLGGDIETTQLLLGVGLGILATTGWALGTLLLRAFATRRGEEMDMVGFTTTQFASAGIVLLIAGLAVDGTGSTNWGSGELWGAVTWIGPVSGLGFACYFLALRHMNAARVSAPMFLVPAVAVVLEVARGNAPTALVLLGMFLAVLGVAMVSLPRELLASAGPRLWRQVRSAATSIGA